MNRLLGIYAQVMCRAIWAARRFLPAGDNGLPAIAVAKRDWEWDAFRECEACGHHGRHRMIEWIEADGPVTTAECMHCGLEATLP